MTPTPVRKRVHALSNFSKDPYGAMNRLYTRNGAVTDLGAGPVRFTLLLGPDANRAILENTDLFSWEQAFAGLVPLAGKGALLANDGEAHRRLRRLVQPAFTARAVTRHIDTIHRHVDKMTNQWQRGDVIDVYPHFQAALRDATIECLFGPRALDHTSKLRERLQTIHQAIDTSSLVRKFQRLGIPSWKRALAARNSIRDWVVNEIRQRRHTGTTPTDTDVLTQLINACPEDVEPLSDDEVCDQLISLLEAGAETTTATLAWALRATTADRTVWEQVEASTAEDTAPLPFLDHVVSETLRLFPATVMASRVVADEFSFDGHRFKAGSKLVISPFHTHRLSSIWTDPESFTPQRWDPESPDYYRPKNYEYLPFGGGSHRCIGSSFATMAVTAALARVVQSAELWLVSKDARPRGLIGMRPHNGLTVLVTDTHPTKEAQQ